MKKLILYFFAIVAPIVSVNAAEPDTSDLASLQDVFEVLDSQPVTYLDLKLERANRILNTLDSNRGCFTNRLGYINGVEYKIVQTPQYQLKCCIEASPHFFSMSIPTRKSQAKNQYKITLSLAQKLIHESVNKDNFEFIIVAKLKDFMRPETEETTTTTLEIDIKDDVLTNEEVVVAKVKNGTIKYYDFFFYKHN